MSVVLLARTDAHLADLPPQSRVDDWAAAVLGKLEQVGELTHRVDGVLDGGDLFHVKSPSRTTHELIQRVSAVHAKYHCPVFGNVGNHDVKYGDIRFLPEAPLGVLFESRVIHPCFDEDEIFFGPATSNAEGVTWYPFNRKTGWSKKGDPFKGNHREPIVRVVGIPYHGTTYDMNRFTTITKGEEDFLVVMAHCLASSQGGSMFEAEDIIRYADLRNLDPDVWFFGHWHKDQGITNIAPGKWVVNPGSLSRGALTQDEMTRIPQVVRMTFGPRVDIESIHLKVAPASEVFDVAGKIRQEGKQITVDALVESLKMALAKPQEGSLLDEVRGMADVPPPVVERTVGYLERAGAR